MLVEKFEDLSPPLAACLEDCEPLPLQEEALPIITRGTESVIISPLGTGKHTLAAVTVVNTLIQSKKGSQVLVLVPEKNQAIHFEEVNDNTPPFPQLEMKCIKLRFYQIFTFMYVISMIGVCLCMLMYVLMPIYVW